MARLPELDSAEANARIKHEKLMDEISWEVPGDEDPMHPWDP